MLTLLVRSTSELAAAVIFPAPLCVQVPFDRVSCPPPVASRVPVLVFVQPVQVSGFTVRVWPLILPLIVPELTRFKLPTPTVPAPVMFDEVVSTEPLTPLTRPLYCPLPLFKLTVPLPLRVNEFSRYNEVLLPSALMLI